MLVCDQLIVVATPVAERGDILGDIFLRRCSTVFFGRVS